MLRNQKTCVYTYFFLSVLRLALTLPRVFFYSFLSLIDTVTYKSLFSHNGSNRTADDKTHSHRHKKTKRAYRTRIKEKH